MPPIYGGLVCAAAKGTKVMPYPTLSASQRAYLFHQDDFLRGLEERAACLYERGYRVHATADPFVFVMTVPYRDGEVTYFLNPVRATCTCRFYTRQEEGERLSEPGPPLPCKHLRGFRALLEKCVCRYQAEGDMQYLRLRVHGLAVLAHEKWNASARTGSVVTPALSDEEGGGL